MRNITDYEILVSIKRFSTPWAITNGLVNDQPLEGECLVSEPLKLLIF